MGPLIGRALAHYRITAAIGAGGMGEVYRATDTKLGRDVALKLLPEAFAADPDRLARFEREAKVLASLNHPGIAHLYGFESTRLEGGTTVHFLAMELVEGEDLAERLKRGPIPVDEAVAVARQVAEALEEAHEKGIVHRDLKPANVKVTPDGRVKVLDFGLAKAFTGDTAAGSSADLSQSPTLAQTGTAAGIILGTAAYMSPEQARGKAVDKRADVWAFGVVLYEMLAGRRLFEGETVSDVLAAVLTREPDWRALPPSTPPSVLRLLHRCLERPVRKRLQAIGEARLVLEDPGPEGSGSAGTAPRWRRVAAAIAGGLALFAAGWLLRPSPRAEEAPLRKVDLSLGELGGRPVLSPDGSRVAYVADGRLLIRGLDRFEALDLSDADDVSYPSWSPDGGHLAYVRHGRAWTVSSDGGRPTELGAVPADLVGSGGSAWTSDGGIVLAGSDTVGLWEIPVGGGGGREILKIDRATEADFHEIAPLPGNRGLIFTVHRKGGPADSIALLAGGARRVLVSVPGEGLTAPLYSPTGHLVYERETTNPGIWAVPFSLERLETTGAPFLAVPGGSSPSVARDGTLCFVRREDRPIELVRVSRGGAVETVAELAGTRTAQLASRPTLAGYRALAGLSLSPEGTRVAISVGAPGPLWVYDLERGSLSQLTGGAFAITRPVWTPRGDRVVYASARDARLWNLSSRRADAAGEEERLSTSDEVQAPLALSPDGRSLVYLEGAAPTRGNLFERSPEASAEARPLFPSRAWGMAASFSPDGRWLAYESVESGRSEVYARPFPEGENRLQLSTEGGETPVWSRSGEVFYHAGGGLYSVSVAARGDALVGSKPALLFRTGGESRLAPVFDVTPDGQRFLMLRSRGSEHVSLVFNWRRELARLGAAAGAGAGRP